MQHDEFIGHVQDRAQLPSRGAAEGASRATLETLAERIPGGLSENLAGQLPREIGEHLRRKSAAPDTAERFDLATFVARVAERAGVDEARATYLVRVVFEVVEEATQGGLTKRLRDALPDDTAAVVGAGSSGGIG